MKSFMDLVEALDSTTSSNAKVELIATYLRTAEPADAAWAAYLLTDQRKRRTVTSTALREIFLRHTELPEWLVAESYAHVGDTAETVALLIKAGHLSLGTQGALPAHSNRRGVSEPASRPVHEWMEEAIPALAKMTREERDRTVVGWWTSLPPSFLLVLHKLLTGGFRLGVSRATVVKAIAIAVEVPETVVTQRITGGFTPSVDFLADLRTAEQTLSTKPYPFYLASPLPDELFGDGPVEAWHIEWKWDGIRAQIIKRAGQVAIWSRGEDLVTDQFPEVALAAEHLSDGTVLDAELLAWGNGEPLPFYELQHRLGRKRVSKKMQVDVPAVAMTFDCLESDGTDLRSEPLESRLKARDRILSSARQAAEGPAAGGGTLRSSNAVAVESWDELERLRRESRDRRVEGFLLKRRGSPYREGRRRGDWWKFKRDPMTLDAVLIYAQAGSGKRANLFTDYTFALRNGSELVPFAKAYSGLSNKELADLDRWIRRHTTERFGPVRQVEATEVFEIAFEDIVPSSRHKSGVATRFPRILRRRPDKPPEEINTLSDARSLIQ
jgi:DNA ligase-1